jgi:hypothetical protein
MFLDKNKFNQKKFLSQSRVRPFMCTLVTLTVPYLSTGLAGCSVNLGNNRDARKLARIPQVKKKKKVTT